MSKNVYRRVTDMLNLHELDDTVKVSELVKLKSQCLSENDINQIDSAANAICEIDTTLLSETPTLVTVYSSIALIESKLPKFLSNLNGSMAAMSIINWCKLQEQEQELARKNVANGLTTTIVLTKEQARAYRSFVTALMSKRINIINSVVYMKEIDGHWTKLDSVTKVKMSKLIAQLLEAMMPYTSKHGNLKNWSELCYEALEKSQIDMTSIQFSDCALLKDGTIVDSCDEVPRVTIEKPIREAVESGKPTVYVKEFQEFLDEAVPDKAVQDRLLDRLAMTFVLDPNKKQSLAKACMLYGPTAQNGKSLTINMLTKAMSVAGEKQVYKSFNLSNFDGYDVASLIDSILLVNDDGTGEFIEAKVSTNIKSAITAGPLTVRQIYRELVTIIPTVQIVCAMNALPSAEDKTAGLDRRFEWFPFTQKINGDKLRNDWFASVKSDDAALMFLQMLVIRAVRIAKTGELVECPDAVNELANSYRDMNVNVKTWIESSGGPSVFRYAPVKRVYDDYVDWCENSTETPLGKKKFTNVFISETELVKKVTRVSETSHPELFDEWKSKILQNPERLNADSTTMLLWCPVSDKK